MTIKTRFAPSPTGFMHIGSLRTAVYAYALAKHNQGSFVLRIEDTDQKRTIPGAIENLQSTLRSFGLVWDEYYIQSQRVSENIYKNIALKLIEDGHAFYCQCQPKNSKQDGYSTQLRDPCRTRNYTSGAIKLKTPDNHIVKYTDYVSKKNVSWNTSTVSDATLLKTDGFPTYHLAVVIDDYDMKITHVLRGHDWKPSTPIHLLLYEYLNYSLPEIGHLTDILDPSGGKMSKRKGTVSIESFINEGYLPEAILNYVILLGWAPKNNQEIFDLSEFIAHFNPNGFQVSNPIFDRKKLSWFNGQYIRKLSLENYQQTIKKFAHPNANDQDLAILSAITQDRIEILSDFRSLTDFIWEDCQDYVDPAWRGLAKEHLQGTIDLIKNLNDWSIGTLTENLKTKITSNNWKTGDFFMNLRIALSGRSVSPPITECIFIMGKQKTLDRIEKVINNILK